MLGDKLRFRFRKVGDLRLLSHHDMMRCLERMLRRGGIPFKSTAGFHPGPRVVFALSLPLGVAGNDEVLELELLQPCEDEDVRTRLNAVAPAGLEFTRVAVVPMKATAVPRRLEYALPIPTDRVAALSERCLELLRNDKIWVERQRPQPKRLNIRPYLRALRVDHVSASTPQAERTRGSGYSLDRESSLTTSDGQTASPSRLLKNADHLLVLDLWVTGTGTARADELLDLLGVRDVQDAGAVLERRVLEIRDEHPPSDSADQPPDGPAESMPLDPHRAAPVEVRPESNQPAGLWNGPVVE